MKALVTGGGGFLGGAIARLLQERGCAVRSFTRSRYLWLDEIDVEQVLGDLADRSAVEQAVAGCDVVFHVAAKAGVWGRYEDYYSTNVTGTENVIAACQAHGVSRLIATSTPSVVHAGGDIAGGDESLPYPDHFEAAYPETKALAEKAVLAANSPTLATVALRPHLVWGPGDPHLIPRVVARAKSGKLRRIGAGDPLVDVTYIDNAAEAHLLAADRLAPHSVVAGKAYFISNGEPIGLWVFINRILSDNGLSPVTRRVTVRQAKLAGRVLEWWYRNLRLAEEPPLTRFVVDQLTTSHWYDISAARRDFGYEPRITIAEGLKRLKQSMQQ
ncbi:MAG: NAD-dependent epimerase/dehydratase family protein [Bacteroidales bacterium]|nr:NAD-dependent epimerase/dehydratase family protein [Bacteroidales bacterium]